MSTLAVSRRATSFTPSARVLGAVEAGRMVRHPAYPLGLTYIAAFAVAVAVNREGGTVANATAVILMLGILFIYAPATIIVANRVAAATYRRRVRGTFDSAPVPDRQRTVAALLGVVRGPVTVAFAATLVLAVVGRFTTTAVANPADAVLPRSVVEYLQFPAVVLGAGMLGVAVARWLPWPGMLPVVVLIMWFGTVALYRSAGPDDLVHAPTWFAPWPVFAANEHGNLPSQPLVQDVWHLVYLLGLGALAGIAALLRTGGPRRGLWSAAAGAAAVTALAAWLQLG